ncbi:glutamine synthetase, partial [Corynebacterium pyruviciproducens]
MFKDAAEALAYIDKEEVVLIDVRFCDLPGVMQHFTIPAKEFKAEALVSGLMFDGSSIRGFTAIHESDMKLVPDVTT